MLDTVLTLLGVPDAPGGHETDASLHGGADDVTFRFGRRTGRRAPDGTTYRLAPLPGSARLPILASRVDVVLPCAGPRTSAELRTGGGTPVGTLSVSGDVASYEVDERYVVVEQHFGSAVLTPHPGDQPRTSMSRRTWELDEFAPWTGQALGAHPTGATLSGVQPTEHVFLHLRVMTVTEAAAPTA